MFLYETFLVIEYETYNLREILVIDLRDIKDI